MGKRLGTLTLLVIATSLTACGSKGGNSSAVATDNMAADNLNMADNNAAMETPPAAAPMSGQDFANAAAGSDAFEIASSKLALDKAQSADVKKFAQQMIDAHTESTAKLKKAASTASPAVTPDPTLSPDLQSKLDALKPQSGAAFDQAYINDQITAHETTLAALQSYAVAGDVPPLKSFATEMVPIVSGHLDMARGLKP